jgi:hypothetical protein
MQYMRDLLRIGFGGLGYISEYINERCSAHFSILHASTSTIVLLTPQLNFEFTILASIVFDSQNDGGAPPIPRNADDGE